MEKAVLIWMLFLLIPLSAEARPIKFGFFYTNDALQEWGGKNELEKRLHETVRETEKTFNVSIAIDFVEPLPFFPPLIAPPRKKDGISTERFFLLLDARNRRKNEVDFIFTITSMILWYEDATDNHEVTFRSVDGNTGDIGSVRGILRIRKDKPTEYLTEVLWHEWGHMLNLKHPNRQACRTIYFVMCEYNPQELPLQIEDSFTQAVRSFAESIQKEP